MIKLKLFTHKYSKV